MPPPGKQEGWTCVTNDKRLRTECETQTVQVMWGLQLLLRLVERRASSANDAIRVAEAMHAVNKRIPNQVVTAFVRKVRSVK